MGELRAVPVLLALLPLLLVGLAAVPRPAQAAPVFFEEDFRGCADGASLTTIGWTQISFGTGGPRECDNAEHFPEERTGHGAPVTFNGTQSFKHHLTTSVIDGWRSPTFSIGGATLFSLGFAIRFESFPGSTFGGAFQFTFRDGGVAAGGFGVRDTGQAHTLNVNSIWDPIVFTLALDTWYVIQFDISRATDRYALFINGTAIDANGGLGGFEQTMRPGAAAHDVDEVAFSDRSSGKAWIDWVFTDRVAVDPIPDLTVSLCGAEVEQTLLDASTDATTDVIFGLDAPPSFLSVVPATGRVLFKTLPPEGPPPVGPTFPVNLTANVSTGEDFELFNVTFTACDPLGWIREFGPAWVVFLAFVAVVVIILLTLWRGAKRRPGR